VTLGARQNSLVEIERAEGEQSLATSNLSQLATGVTVKIGAGQRSRPNRAWRRTRRRRRGERQ
jgi:hypothetical protein